MRHFGVDKRPVSPDFTQHMQTGFSLSASYVHFIHFVMADGTFAILRKRGRSTLFRGRGTWSRLRLTRHNSGLPSTIKPTVGLHFNLSQRLTSAARNGQFLISDWLRIDLPLLAESDRFAAASVHTVLSWTTLYS